MSSTSMPLRKAGIYHTLPDFPDAHKNLTAIITGANGISGFGALRALLSAPERWSKIYALVRHSPPREMMALLSAEERSRIQHVKCDFLASPDKIAEALKSADVKADYIFFYSYLQPPPKEAGGSHPWSNAEELVEVNSALLRNFLGGLKSASIIPKRFLLQTGAKNYGAHLGTIRAPAIESDPRVLLEPNFYYPQEDMLWDWCKSSGTTWNVIRPSWIIGAVNNAQMNALHPFAVYAAVQAHLDKPLPFPGDFAAWQSQPIHATAILTGYLSEWAVLEDKCKNEAFNATDTSPLPWNRFWPELGRWYGVKEVGRPEDDESKYTTIKGKPGKDTPMGYGPPSTSSFTFALSQWAQDPKNAAAWKELMAKHNLTHNPFDNIQANFTFGDGAFMAFSSLSMNKARRLGWTGFVDTTESIFQMYDEMNHLGMLPPMLVKDPRPSV